MILGYARVSTEDQHLDAQIAALEDAGAERIWSEKVSGAKAQRPELKALLEHLRPGDVVTVTKYDRLSRSLQDLLTIVEVIREKGAGFRSLAEDIDTTTPAGRLVFHVLPPSPSLRESGFLRGPKRGCPLPASEAGSVAGPLPYRPNAAPKYDKCETKTDAASRNWRGSLR